ncbi:MAG: hypothetical protein V3U16_01605 [Candidatus Neomarinimicrobiota bacterium]
MRTTILILAALCFIFVSCENSTSPMEPTTLDQQFAMADPVDRFEVSFAKKGLTETYKFQGKSGDPDWLLLGHTEPFANAKYSLDGTTLTMRIKAQKLTPGIYYFVEVVIPDGWVVLNEYNCNVFHFMADADGHGDITIAVDVTASSGEEIEINVKLAEWSLMYCPSTEGVPSEWNYTPDLGYDYVVYGTTRIDVP